MDPLENDNNHEGDDIEFEFEDSDATPARLRTKLKKCVEEKQEYLLGWQRAKADLINARKEFEESKKSLRTYATEGLIVELSTVLESFDSAFSNKEAWEKVDANWRTGVEYIHTQFLSILQNNGLEVFDPTGEQFNPSRHDAVENVPLDEGAEEGTVATVLQKGLLLNGKVIKPARVKVYQST